MQAGEITQVKRVNTLGPLCLWQCLWSVPLPWNYMDSILSFTSSILHLIIINGYEIGITGYRMDLCSFPLLGFGCNVFTGKRRDVLGWHCQLDNHLYTVQVLHKFEGYSLIGSVGGALSRLYPKKNETFHSLLLLLSLYQSSSCFSAEVYFLRLWPAASGGQVARSNPSKTEEWVTDRQCDCSERVIYLIYHLWWD